MKFASIGTRAPSHSARLTRSSGRAGFTLIEALVALTIIVAFASALVPMLAQARRIIVNADGRIAAQILLRSLLDETLDRSALTSLSRDGEQAGLQWHIEAEPASIDTTFLPDSPMPTAGSPPAGPKVRWVTYKIVASVSWAPGEKVEAETFRLARLD